ncbi:MAG: hypothetical protein R2706_18810 [Acidimicrobiales bacterium]
MRDGSRRITHITEVAGMEGEIITLQDVFLFDYGAGVDENGKFKGQLKPTGVRPKFAQKLADHGIRLSPEMFSLHNRPTHGRSGGRPPMLSPTRSSLRLADHVRHGRPCCGAEEASGATILRPYSVDAVDKHRQHIIAADDYAIPASDVVSLTDNGVAQTVDSLTTASKAGTPLVMFVVDLGHRSLRAMLSIPSRRLWDERPSISFRLARRPVLLLRPTTILLQEPDRRSRPGRATSRSARSLDERCRHRRHDPGRE